MLYGRKLVLVSEPVVRKAIARIHLPIPVRVSVVKHPEVSVRAELTKIFFGDARVFNDTESARSHIRFHYDPRKAEIFIQNIRFADKYKRQGIGRLLVETTEDIGRYLRCEASRFSQNQNPNFWAHMGYRLSRDGRHWEKYL